MRCCLQRQDSKMSGARPEKYQNMMGKYFILTFYSMFITARNRSLRRLCFYTCLVSHSVHIGEVSASVHDGIHPPPPEQQQTPTPESRPPLGSRHPPVQCMLGDTGNKRAVRILLECILVSVFLP